MASTSLLGRILLRRAVGSIFCSLSRGIWTITPWMSAAWFRSSILLNSSSLVMLAGR